jgi:hypothetical protein
MDPFKTLLININNKLELPQPTKSRIILEISADLNDAYYTFQNQGMSEKEAIEAAKGKFNLDKHSLNELVRVHQTSFQRWFDHLSTAAQTWWEWVILICLLIFVIISGSVTIMKIPLVEQASPFVWAIFILAIIAITVFVQKIYQIYIKKDHRLATVKRGVPFLLFVSGLSLLTCMWGYYWQLYNFKEYGHILETKMIYLLHTTDGSFPQVFKDLVDWMIASSSFVMIGMLAAILFGFMWYFLMIKISKIEEAEAAVLLGE